MIIQLSKKGFEFFPVPFYLYLIAISAIQYVVHREFLCWSSLKNTITNHLEVEEKMLINIHYKVI